MSHEIVAELLMTQERITYWPPLEPKNGNVFVLKYKENREKNNYVSDGYNWRYKGRKFFKYEEREIEKRDYTRRHGNKMLEFKRYVYQWKEVNSSEEMIQVIHYLGADDFFIPNLPHGNRKNNMQRGHIRTMPSKIKDMKESKKKNPLEKYREMVTDSYHDERETCKDHCWLMILS